MNGLKPSRYVRSHVAWAHLQIQYDSLLEFCRQENRAHGKLLEVEVCSPQLFFHLLPWEVRRWDDKLLTTLHIPSYPLLATGTPHWWEESLTSPRLTLILNFTYSPCLFVSSITRCFQVQRAPRTLLHPSIAAISFLSEWQCSVRFVYLQYWRFEACKQWKNQHVKRVRWGLFAGICRAY